MQRLYVDAALAVEGRVELTHKQSHYLIHVLRMKKGAQVLVFNGHDGEWCAQINSMTKKTVQLSLIAQERPQSIAPDLLYCFAPLKHARLDYMVQKAVEMGASQLMPVITHRTQVARLNAERMKANIIEAAEQCGLLYVPQCLPMKTFDELISHWDKNEHLIFCDEFADSHNPIHILSHLDKKPVGVIIGPEGGFSQDERAQLRQHPSVVAITLGKRILRADTAGVAALALITATQGL